MARNSDISADLAGLKPFEEYPYASYVARRTNGAFISGAYPYKRHSTLGHAKTAVGRSPVAGSKIFQWVGNEWVLIMDEVDGRMVDV